tara:strand:+ start:126 stop:1052 length:927 start_codon:yes stop_codon:yes gene_type:complete
MAFNKIQPEQIQMPTFFSDSGGLNIDQTDTGIRINVSPNLTGTFNFSGTLLTNDKEVFGLGNTGTNKFVVNSGNLMFMGSNTEIGDGVNDHDNLAILANASRISGLNNVILNGLNITFNTGSQRNTALAGANITFTTPATGSVAMKDGLVSTSQSVTRPHSFYATFESGNFFERGHTYFGHHASFQDSGIFSGSLEVLGSGFLSGQEITTKHYLTGYASGNYVNLYGGQSVGGQKVITDPMIFETGFQLPAYTGTVQGAHGVGVSSPFSPFISTGTLAISGHTLYVCVGGTTDNVPKWAGIPISGILV